MARASVAPKIRARVLPPETRRLTRDLDRYWPAMYRRLEPGLVSVVAEVVPSKASGLAGEIEIILRRLAWDRENRILSRVVAPVTANVARLGFDAVSAELGLTVSFDLNARPVRRVLSSVATEITQVTTTSQGRIARMIADGIEKGLSVEQIVRGVPPGTMNIRGPVPAFPGIRGLVDSWGSTGIAPRLGPGTSPTSSRSYLIALTETGNAFNRSSLAAYESTGFVTVCEVFDGPDCGWSSHDDPSLAHGSKRRLEACQAQPLSHPRCQRAFGASLDDKPSVSPYQGRDPGNVPGASPGLRPDDPQPLNGRTVPISGGFGPQPGPVSPAPPGGLAQAIEDAGARIRSIPDTERGIVFDDDGTIILDKLGNGPTARTAGSVDFTDAELASMRGKVLMHNHPGAYQSGYDHATSFSPDDINLAIGYGIREMRIVGKGADFVARVELAADEIPSFRTAASAAYNRVRATTYEAIAMEKEAARKAASSGGHFDVMAYGKAEREIYKRAEMETMHRVWELVSRQFPGFTYVRTLRPSLG